jgi:hypothetical protein
MKAMIRIYSQNEYNLWFNAIIMQKRFKFDKF